MAIARLGILISGGGSNLQAILDACRSGVLKGRAEVAAVVSNRADAFGLKRAESAGVSALFLDPKAFPSRADYFAQIAAEFKKKNVALVCLAGFLLKVEPNFIEAYRGRILNIHPALLPKYGGKGMYGHFVHEAVVAAGEKESGCSVHLVDEEFDRGPVLAQRKVPVLPMDKPEDVAARVLKEEHVLFPSAIAAFLDSQKIA